MSRAAMLAISVTAAAAGGATIMACDASVFEPSPSAPMYGCSPPQCEDTDPVDSGTPNQDATIDAKQDPPLEPRPDAGTDARVDSAADAGADGDAATPE